MKRLKTAALQSKHPACTYKQLIYCSQNLLKRTIAAYRIAKSTILDNSLPSIEIIMRCNELLAEMHRYIIKCHQYSIVLTIGHMPYYSV